MRIILINIILLSFIFSGCQTWDLLTKKYSTLYSEKEKIILDETTTSIDFKYGYDPDLDIDYVYKAGRFADKEIIAKSSGMKKVLMKYTDPENIIFYEKIVQLKETMIWKMNRFRDKEKWENYTYIQKYLIPETDFYLNILEKNIIQIDSGYKETIEERKIELKNQVAYDLQKKQEDYEKKLREERRPDWKR